MDQTYCGLKGRLTMATVIVRDPFIAGHTRWETNERAKASLRVEKSSLRRVSVWPLRLLLPIIGPVPSFQLHSLGLISSVPAFRATTVGLAASVSGPSGCEIKPCILI